MFSATDWMLKRVLKSILKKTVGRYLQSEPDLDQLDFLLSKGTFELRNVLLNCDAVNAQLALDGWSITAGYIGLVKGVVPLTAGSSSAAAAAGAAGFDATPANILVDEVLLTVSPCPSGSSSSNARSGANAAGSSTTAAATQGGSSNAQRTQQQQHQQQQPDFSDEYGLLSQVGVLDGIKLIAGGLETLLQRVSVAATNVTIRLEIPPPPPAAAAATTAAAAAVGAEVVLRLDSVHFFDATRQQQQQQQLTAAQEYVKCISVAGLTVELLDLTEDQYEDEQSKLMAASQILDSSGSSMPAQQQQQSAAAAAAEFKSSFMSRSSMRSSMRASFMASSTAAAAVAPDFQQQQQQPELDQTCYEGLLLFGPSCQQGLDLKIELRLARSARVSNDGGGVSNPAGGVTNQQPGGSHGSSSSSAGSRITVDISSSAVNLALHPWQLPLMDLVSTAAAAASPAAAGSSAEQQQQYGPQQQQRGWGHRSFAEDLFFPHCEGLVAESLGASGFWQQQQQRQGLAGSSSSSASLNPDVPLFGSGLMGSAGSGLYSSMIINSQYNANDMSHDNLYHSGSSGSSGVYSVYQDARSVFGGSSSSSSSAASRAALYNSLNPNVAAAKVRQQQQQRVTAAAAATAASYSIRACIPAATVSLYYHTPSIQVAAAAAAARSQQQQQQSDVTPISNTVTFPSPPGLLIHCNGLVTSVDLGSRSCHLTVKCYCLEVTEGLPGCWTSTDPQLQGLSPRDVGAVPRLIPAVQGTTGFVQQAPAFVVAGSSSSSSSSSVMQIWPVLVVGGSPLEPGRGLPAVQRPSVTVKASLHYKDSRKAELSKAAIDCELLPVTCWITNGLIQRLTTITALQQQQQQQQQPVTANSQEQQQQQQRSVTPPGVEKFLAVHVSRICVVLPLVLPTSEQLAAAAAAGKDGGSKVATGRFVALDLHAGSSSSSSHQHIAHHGSSSSGGKGHQHHQHQHHAGSSSSRVLPFMKVASPSAAAAGGTSRQQQQQVLTLEGCLTRLRLFYVTHVASRSRSSSSGSTGLAAAAAKVAAAAAAVGSSVSNSKLLQQQQQGYSLNRLLRKQQQQGSGSGGSSSSSGLKLVATCVLDACPGGAAAASPTVGLRATTRQLNPCATAAAAAAEGLDLGPDDVPWGSAVFVTVTLNPAAQPAASTVAAAAAMTAAHARDRVADSEGDYVSGGWGAAAAGSSEASKPGLAHNNSVNNNPAEVLGFRQVCQKDSNVVIGVRAPAVTGFMSLSDITGLVRSIVAAAAGAPETGSAKQQQQQQQDRVQQVALLLQCRLQCYLQSTAAAAVVPQGAAVASHPGSSSTSGQQNPGQKQQAPDHTTLEISVDEISWFQVQGLGGTAAATASCLCIQGLQLLTSQPQSSISLTSGQTQSDTGQLCALLLPKHSKTVGPPGLEVLMVSHDSSSSSSGLTSLLLRGATLSTDPGGLSMDWVLQIVSFLNPITAAAAAAATPPTGAAASRSEPQQQRQQQRPRQQFVVNLQDLAIRCEPRTDAPTSHNSSRMAAAFLLEGAHWRKNPKPNAPQHLLLHSLGFYVAAAAARSSLTPSGLTAGILLLNPRGSSGGLLNPTGSSGSSSSLGCWDPAAPVDMHGFSLSGAGYHCLAQEGGLAVTIKTATAAAAAGSGDAAANAGTLEIEVTNSHLTGSLRKDTAALSVQLMNQWSAHALLRNPPRYVSTGSSSSSSTVAAAGAADSTQDGRANPAAAAVDPQQQQQQQPGLLVGVEEDAFRVSKRPGSSSSRRSSSGDLQRAASLASSIGSLQTAATAASVAAAKRQQHLESSVFLSGGWYPTPNPSTVTTAAHSVVDFQQQQQQHDSHISGQGSEQGTAAAAEVDAAAGEQQQQQQQQDEEIDSADTTQPGFDPHDWGIDVSQKQQQQQQQRWQQHERRGLLSLLDTEYPSSPAAAAAADGWEHERAASAENDLFSNLDEGLLAASILAQLPGVAAAAAASGDDIPEPVPVVLDDFFINPDSLKVTSNITDDITDSDLGFSGYSGYSNLNDHVMFDSDDEYNIISPRAAAEAAAAAARARRAAATGFSRSSLEGFTAEEAAAAGVWYDNTSAAVAGGADLGSSSTSSDLPPAAAAVTSDRSSSVNSTAAQDPTAAAAAAAVQRMPVRVREDYVAPGTSTPDQSGSPTVAAAAAGSSDMAQGDTDTRAVSAAAAGFSNAPSKKQGFVSPWSRVLSHPVFQHLLPLDPNAPRPVTKIVFKGLSGMFVLHDRGAIITPSSSGSSLGSRRIRAAAGSSGGRLEVEVDGVAAELLLFEPGHCYVSRMSVALGTIEIRDCRRVAAAAAGASSAGSSMAAAAAATAAAAKAAASAAASAAAAGHGPRRVAAAAAAAGSASGSSSRNAQGSSGTSAGSSSSRWCRVLSIRRPGTKGGAKISRSSSSSSAAHTSAATAAGGSSPTPDQQQPLLGGMLQGWPAAVLAPDSLLPAAAVVLETVKPDPNASDDAIEYRLGVALLPVRLKLKQELVAFLVAFAAAVSDAVAAVENPLVAAMAAAAAAAAAEAGMTNADSDPGGSNPGAGLSPVAVPPPFFQKVVIWGTGVSVDYCPRRVDIAALRDGDFLELLNLVPWGGVDLTLHPLRFNGIIGWEGLAAVAAAEWLQYIAKTQAHKFLTGVAPIRSVIKVTNAVAALLAGPAAIMQDALGGAVTSAVTAATRGVSNISTAVTAGSSGSSGAQQLQQRLRQVAATVAAAGKAAAAANKQQQQPSSSNRVVNPTNPLTPTNSLHEVLKHNTAGFARVLLYEALGLGAGVAAGAEVVLAGGRPVTLPPKTPAGLAEGFRAAAGEVQGGFVAAAEVLTQGLRSDAAATKPLGQVALGFVRVAPAAAAAPARGLAAAARTALLGAQNALGSGAVGSQQQQQQQGLAQQQQQQQHDDEQDQEIVDAAPQLESEDVFL